MDLKEEQILGDTIENHWYYVSKWKAIRWFLHGISPRNLLDVGAGSGYFSRKLLESNVCERAVLVDPYYDTERVEIVNGKPMEFVRKADNYHPDLIVMMDVLEHVEDDLSLLKSYTDGLASGKHVLITVPAFQALWSGHDVFLEHYRRYTASQIQALVKQAGMTPVKIRYFYAPLFPLIAAVRILQRITGSVSSHKAKSTLKDYPRWVNSVLTQIHAFDRRFLLPVNRLFGLSVFCLCVKE